MITGSRLVLAGLLAHIGVCGYLFVSGQYLAAAAASAAGVAITLGVSP